MKLHINDKVLVTAGKDRGKSGKITRVYGDRNKIVIEKINIRTRHIKKRQGQAGQKIHYEGAIDASNAMIICPECSKVTRVAYRFLKTGGKERVCKKCSQSLDKPVERKTTKKR